jgi:hypothetical protein
MSAKNLLLLAVGATIVFGVYQFWSTEWSSGYDPRGRCLEGVRAPARGLAKGVTTAEAQTWPPGTKCGIKKCRYRRRGRTIDADVCVTAPELSTVFVSASATDWLLLMAFATLTGFVLAVVLFVVIALIQFGRRIAHRMLRAGS